MWNRRGVVGIRFQTDSFQEKILHRISKKGVPFSKSQTVSHRHPEERGHRHQDEAIHHRREHILSTNQTSIKKDQSRRRHHENKSRADQHPGIVPRVDLGGRGQCGFDLGDSRCNIGGGIFGAREARKKGNGDQD